MCAYNAAFAAFPTRDADSVKELMTEILETNKQRFRMARAQEIISGGGVPSPTVTKLSQVVSQQAAELVKLDQAVQKVTVNLPSDVGPRTGGILARLFGAPATEPERG